MNKCWEKRIKNIPYKDSILNCKKKTPSGNLIIECWDNEKNIDEPRYVYISSGKKYWFKCDKCYHSFNSVLYSITGKKSWCPYCSIHNIIK